MKFRILTVIFATTFFAATAISAKLFAQEQPVTSRRASSAFHVPHRGASAFRPTPGTHAAVKNEGNVTLSPDGSAPSLITIDAPQGGKGFLQGTVPLSINAGGTITGVIVNSHFLDHGFLRTANGKLTSFDVPGALETIAEGINDAGAIVGSYMTGDGEVCGFVRFPDGTFTTFTVPGAAATFGININNGGTISGDYTDQRDNDHGFVLDVHGNFTTFDAPGAEDTEVVSNGMNAKGAITGYKEFDVLLGQAFLRSPNGDVFPTFDVYGAIITESQGLPTNNSQTVVGYSLDQNFVSHGFLRKVNGTITQFNDPDAGVAPGQGTEAYTINSTNWTAGTFADPDPNQPFHGFVRSPGNVFTNFDAPGAILTNPTDINPAGVVAGYYFDENMAYHGFVRTP